MGGTAGYFFPPNADPIYHEITDEAVGWINGLYGPAMQDAFDARGIPYFNYATSTTSSTWATATRCPPPGSAPPA